MPTTKPEPLLKDNCKKCKKKYTLKTLKKNNGVCGKCTNTTKGITKKNIPKILKDAVWETHIGDKLKGNCYVCKKEITATKFQAGHIKSEYSGGSITVKNLRPTCKSCNVKTGVFNMDDIKNSLTGSVDTEEKKCLGCGIKFKKGEGGTKEHYITGVSNKIEIIMNDDLYYCEICSDQSLESQKKCAKSFRKRWAQKFSSRSFERTSF